MYNSYYKNLLMNENWTTRRSKEKLNKPNEPILADELY